LIGLTIPDKDLKWNEARGHYDYGQIDWNEFKQVVSGHGPCNTERIAARKKAEEDGKWVREAAMAYAEKRKARKAS
jgi:ring-1,2-phenylacetyl-CoA epoxidase subunit PaaA